MANQQVKTHKYYMIRYTNGVPENHGTITLRTDQIKNYACALGCKLMRHLPLELRAK